METDPAYSDFMRGLDSRLTQGTILVVCLTMIVGGLLIFFLRLRARNQEWKLEFNQVIGTIFFFPTLILLAIYLHMSRDAVVGILGAFLGSLFTRAISPRYMDAGSRDKPEGNGGKTNTSPPSNDGPASAPAVAGGDRRS